MIKKQFTLYLVNRPGEIARAAKILARARVNIEGISVSESTDVGLVQIVVDDAKRAARVLDKARIPHTVQNIALMPLKNRPGSLARMASKLAQTGVNINYIYGTACSCGHDCDCRIVVSAPDLKRVQALWKK